MSLQFSFARQNQRALGGSPTRPALTSVPVASMPMLIQSLCRSLVSAGKTCNLTMCLRCVLPGHDGIQQSLTSRDSTYVGTISPTKCRRCQDGHRLNPSPGADEHTYCLLAMSTNQANVPSDATEPLRDR